MKKILTMAALSLMLLPARADEGMWRRRDVAASAASENE